MLQVSPIRIQKQMAIELCADTPNLVMSPRISFSFDICSTEVIPTEQRNFSSNSPHSGSNPDFNFLVHHSLDQESSSADDLFLNGKLLPTQIKQKAGGDRDESQPPPLLLPSDLHNASTNSDDSRKDHVNEAKRTNLEAEEKHNSKSFWRFKRSSSLNCGSGYARSLCPLPPLSRSNSTGSSSSVKRPSSSSKDKHQPIGLTKPSQSLPSTSYQKPPLKKNYGSYGNGVRINPVLNVPATNLFGLGSIFFNGKDKSKKK